MSHRAIIKAEWVNMCALLQKYLGSVDKYELLLLLFPESALQGRGPMPLPLPPATRNSQGSVGNCLQNRAVMLQRGGAWSEDWGWTCRTWKGDLTQAGVPRKFQDAAVTQSMATCPPKAKKQAKLVERKGCFISDAGNWGVGWWTSV